MGTSLGGTHPGKGLSPARHLCESAGGAGDQTQHHLTAPVKPKTSTPAKTRTEAGAQEGAQGVACVEALLGAR